MSAKVLQMVTTKSAAEEFQRTVETVEASVNFTIQVIANEDGSNRLCQIDLPNQEGAQGRLCRAFLAPEDVDQLVGALTAWKALP
jgi:acetoacetate decarboxylase